MTYLKGLPVEERFWAQTVKTDGCWLWTGSTAGRRYGRLTVGNRLVSAHRFSYELHFGALPPGFLVDHLHTCPKTCVRPDHLRLVTNKQNAENRSGARAGSASGVWGVTFDKGRWRARVRHDGKEHSGGSFGTLEEAGEAAQKLRKKLFTHNDKDYS